MTECVVYVFQMIAVSREDGNGELHIRKIIHDEVVEFCPVIYTGESVCDRYPGELLTQSLLLSDIVYECDDTHNVAVFVT